MDGQFGGGPYVASSTTTTQSTTHVNATIRFDKSYFKTLPGLLKVVVMVINIIGFICVSVSPYHWYSSATWFGFCAWAGFFTTGTLLAFYCFHVIEKFHFIPWLLVEFVYCAMWSFFFFTAGCTCASWGKVDDSFAAGAFFGFCSCLVYGFDAYSKWVDWKSGRIAQGERHVTTQQTSSVAPTPAY